MTTTETRARVMAMDDDTYYGIIEALEVENAEGYPMYSVAEIAEQFGVTGSEVQYIYNAECCE